VSSKPLVCEYPAVPNRVLLLVPVRTSPKPSTSPERMASNVRRETQSRSKISTKEEPYVEGVYYVRPKERERRLAKQRVDRSHRGVGGVRQCRPPPWTTGETAVLALSIAILFADVFLAVFLLFVL
jgi:hypothetical protein